MTSVILLGFNSGIGKHRRACITSCDTDNKKKLYEIYFQIVHSIYIYLMNHSTCNMSIDVFLYCSSEILTRCNRTPSDYLFRFFKLNTFAFSLNFKFCINKGKDCLCIIRII